MERGVRGVGAVRRGEVREVESAIGDVVAEWGCGALEEHNSEEREKHEDGGGSDEHAHDCERGRTARTRNRPL